MFIFRRVTLPVITCLLLTVTVPYVIAAGVVPIIGEHFADLVSRTCLRLAPGRREEARP